jgi:uncharacterized protein involved in exopolysaccharide biosynthesis
MSTRENGGGHAVDADPAPFPVFRVIAIVLDRWRLIVGYAFAGATLLAGVALLRRVTYTASATFIAQGANDNSRSSLGSLAAQYGFALPAVGSSQSPEFYAELLRSREMLDSVAFARYTYVNKGQRRAGTLADVYETVREDSNLTRMKTTTKLSKAMSVDVVRQTNMVRLSVRARYPDLAVEIVDRALAEVNAFNLKRRRSQAAEERRFVESRMAAASDELARAEDRVRDFLAANRSYQAPALQLEHSRLLRDVDLRQAVYTQLAQSFEQAKIDEVRDTPVITVVDHPAAEPNPRGIVVKLVVGFILGLMVGTLVGFMLELFRNGSLEGRADYQDLVTTMQSRGGVLARLAAKSVRGRVSD